jgi:hypothetical protein
MMNVLVHRASFLLVVALIAGWIACDSPEDPEKGYVLGATRGSRAGMLLTVSAQGVPEVGRPLKVTLTYRVAEDSGWVFPDTLVANGYLRRFSPSFQLLSGDSVWVDTLYAATEVTRSYTLRPLKHGDYVHCVDVSAFVDSALTIGASACLFIHMP